MTPKIPHRHSVVRVLGLKDDWVGITTLSQEKLGPSLKNSLVGATEYYKNMLDHQISRDPDRGIAHFKDILRPELTMHLYGLRSCSGPGEDIQENLFNGLLESR